MAPVTSFQTTSVTILRVGSGRGQHAVGRPWVRGGCPVEGSATQGNDGVAISRTKTTAWAARPDEWPRGGGRHGPVCGSGIGNGRAGDRGTQREAFGASNRRCVYLEKAFGSGFPENQILRSVKKPFPYKVKKQNEIPRGVLFGWYDGLCSDVSD